MSDTPTQPDQFDYLDEDIGAGDGPDSTYIAPDEPMGSHSVGVTAEEERRGETFDERTKHTTPEVWERPIGDGEPPLGTLVTAGDHDVDDVDDESNVVATDAGYGVGSPSAEEAAMHRTEEP